MKKILVLAVLAIAVLAAMPASASCFPDKQFGQLGSDGSYRYSDLPGADPATIIGRFWQPGSRTLNNEGTYSASTWFLPSGGRYYINGFLGAEGPVGCVANEMLTVVQARTGNGSSFFAARVNETPALAVTFDYTRLGTDFAAVEIPNPQVAVTNKAGTIVTMNVTASPVLTGYYGETGSEPTATLSGLRLMRAFGASRPSAAAADWTATGQSAAAAGGTINSFAFDCATAPAGQDLFLAWQVSFNGGEVFGDYVGASTQVRCNSTLANPGKGKGKGHNR
jgi:hypothetical protein